MDDCERRALRIAREALDLDDPHARADFLAHACAADATLRKRVDDLLDRFGRSDDAPPPEAPVDALIGTLLGPFRVLEQIGRGGMGVVYRGLREGADFVQEAALKLVRRGFDFDDVHARFLRERRILARLSHPNLARFIDGGVAPDGRPWFALEFVRGDPLTRWCDTRQLDLRARVRLFLDVCAAVQYAHAQLVVHRDLKPANVLVDERGAVRLLDFGIARLLDGGDDGALTVMGSRYALTPEYAAPEQFAGTDVGVGADVYSLGVILFELLSGVLPVAVDRHDAGAAERQVRETPPQSLLHAIGQDLASQHARLVHRASSLRSFRSRVRGDLSRIVAKALEKEPQRRYATVEAFAGDLRRWLAGAPVQISGNRLGYRLGKFVRRNAVAVGTVVVLVAGLLATTGWALHSAWLEHGQRQAALAEVARAAAVRDYVMLMFRSAASEGGTETLTARDVLKRGADDIFERFRDEPAVGQTTALMLSELYTALDDSEGAAPLLERLLAWPGIEHNPETRASAQYQLADIRFQQGRLADTRALLDDAQAFWTTNPTRYRDPLSRSRIVQGRLERGEGRLDDSIRTLREGADARTRLFGKPDIEVGYMLVSLSISLSRANRMNDALQAADEAVDVYETLGMAQSSAGLAALSNRAMVAWSADERDAALDDIRRVGDLRLSLYGPSSELAKVRAHQAAMLAKLGRHAEALPIFEDALRIAVQFGGENGRVAFDTRRRMVETCLALGRIDQADALVASVLAQSLAEPGVGSVEAAVARGLVAKVRAAQGRLVDAHAEADAADAIFAALGPTGESSREALRTWRQTLPPPP